MLCSPRLRVFVPHDFGFQPIRIAEEDAQGSAEIGIMLMLLKAQLSIKVPPLASDYAIMCTSVYT